MVAVGIAIGSAMAASVKAAMLIEVIGAMQ
jgi:hypothetical protein